MNVVTDNHLEYLEEALEPKFGYPYQELYEQSQNFLYAHSISLNYAGTSRRMAPTDEAFTKCFPWEDRYNTLVHHGTFYENICKLQDIRWHIADEVAWRIELDLNDIPYEMANFEICYCWMRPRRLFNADWRKIKYDVYSVPPFTNECEANAWCFVDKMYTKIIEEHLPICMVEEFMEHRL